MARLGSFGSGVMQLLAKTMPSGLVSSSRQLAGSLVVTTVLSSLGEVFGNMGVVASMPVIGILTVATIAVGLAILTTFAMIVIFSLLALPICALSFAMVSGFTSVVVTGGTVGALAFVFFARQIAGFKVSGIRLAGCGAATQDMFGDMMRRQILAQSDSRKGLLAREQ